MDRYDRSIRFFGAAGQDLIGRERLAIVGCGGLGEHVVQQTACLGVEEIIGIDDEFLDETNRNRYVIARAADPIPGTHKVDIAERAVAELDPSVKFSPIKASLFTQEAFDAIRKSTLVFGCVDNEGARLVLMELACAFQIPYFDLATDIPNDSPLDFGGRVIYTDAEPGCLVCRGALDLAEARVDLQSMKERADTDRIYGVNRTYLERSGPSVVSLNGVVASLAVTEFIMKVTGLRQLGRELSYRGRTGIVTRSSSPASAADCHYCQRLKGSGEGSGVFRYLEAVDQLRSLTAQTR